MIKKCKKGFTIIELIVVIAIIAVLAAIVLVNVTQYINKGKDAAITGNLAGILTDSAQIFDTTGAYTTVCSDPTVAAALAAADTANQTGAVKCNPAATVFAACAQLLVTPGNYFCVDSTGTKKTVTGTCDASWALTACPS